MRADGRLGTRVLLWALTVLTLFAVSVVEPVHAQPVSAKKRWTARKLGGEGMDLFAAGDYEAALEKFQAADELVPAPTLKLRVARCLEKLDRLLEAAATYRTVIETELARTAPAVHRKAREEAVPELAELRKQIPTVRVLVKGPGSDTAAVTLGGEEFPSELFGKRHELDPGTYRFEAERLSDGATVRRQVVLARGQHQDVVLQLVEPGAAPVPEDDTPPSLEPDGEADPWWIAGWVSIGIGGAALSMGSLVGVIVLAEEDSLLEKCPDRNCPPEAHDDAEQFDTLRAVSTAGFIVGSVGLAAGVTMLLLAPGDGAATADIDGEGSSDEDSDELDVEARLAPCSFGPGLCVRGTF